MCANQSVGCGEPWGLNRGRERAAALLLVGFVIVAGLFLPSAPLGAEESAVALSGHVSSVDGWNVSGARVLLRQAPGSVSREVRSDDSGAFRIGDLPAGTYWLTVSSSGFGTFEQAVDLRTSHEVEVQLKIATVRQEIVVSSQLPEFGGELTLPGQDLEETASSDVALSLRGEAGISSIRRGPINLEPTVRGLQETQVAMFVDGNRTFSAGPGRMDSDISHVNPHAVEEVRVVKGPYALTWGAGTLSALEVTTFSPPFATGGKGLSIDGRVDANWGENANNRDAAAGVWGGSDRFAFSVLVGSRAGDDYEDGAGRIVPADYTSDEARWSFASQFGGGTVLRYFGGYQAQDDIDYPGRILDATYFRTRNHALELTWEPSAGAVTEVYGQLYANRKDHRMNNDEKPTAQPMAGRIPPFGIDVDLVTESNTMGGKFHLRFGEGAWGFKVGGDAYFTDQTADRTIVRRGTETVLFRDIVWPDAELDDVGIYAQAIWERDAVQLGSTVRLDRAEASAGRPSDFFLANTTGNLDQTDTDVSAAFNARLRVRDAWILTAGVGRAVRVPTAAERYSDRLPATKFQLPAEFMGNPALAPESSLELDLGSEIQAGSLMVEVDLFYRRIDDYITVQADPSLPKRLPLSPPVVYRYINGNRATFRGGELHLRQRLGEVFSWVGSLSYTRADDDLFDEPVLGIPPLMARLRLRVDPRARRWWGELGTTVADRQDRVAVSRFEVPTPGFTVFDLRGGYRFEGWELRAGVENLTDKEFTDHLNAKNPFTGLRVAEPGRNLYLGVGVEF